ncbi:MAG TPA: dihydrolipoyl dehydrogenase [Aigarchaeota archaeon]|nr:dihydrolipoyl dehydrogenase [Aigarchaeota archaeon]
MAAQGYDAVVIGGGPGGYVCAIRLGQLGKKTLLVEEYELGGECTNFGCIPSKIFIAYASKIHSVNKLISAGSASGYVKPNMHALLETKEKVIKRLREGISYLLKNNKVEVIKGHAELPSPDEVEITKNTGGKIKVKTRNVVLATGTEPVSLPSIPFDGRRVISYKEALSLAEVPRSMLVVGAGPIGLELGTAFAKLGAEVTVVELMKQVLPGLDGDVARVVKRGLDKLGVKTHLETTVEEYSYLGDRLRVRLTTGDEYEVDYVLVAVGKRAGEWSRKLSSLGVRLNEKGFVVVDDGMRTSVDGVYAIGDVTGPPFLAHRASRQGIVAAENIAGLGTVFDNRAIPNGIFTDPEVASVGLTEGQAREQGYEVKAARFPFSALGRGVLEEETEGFVKVVIDAKSEVILGLHIVAPHATELINEASLAVEMAGTAEDLGYTIHVHPTFGEALSEAAHAVLGKAIHVARR